jgi:D-alanyl-D-alanine carboxypeptidase
VRGGAAAPAQGLAAGARLAPACIEAEADKADLTGTVLVAASGEVTSYVRGRTAAPASPMIGPDARFNLGSAGKMFTGVAVLQLVEAGKVGLDDPIGRYVDGLTPEASAASVRQLLTHSSGLGNFFTPPNLAAIVKAQSLGELKPLIAADKPAFPPGSRYAYSNSGFLLLGLLIERASGQSYGDYLRGHIFEPAGMADSGLDPGPSPPRAVAMTSLPDGPQQAGPPSPGPLRPAIEGAHRGTSAGGSFSTAEDMARFLKALQEGKLVSAASFKAMASQQIAAGPPRGPGDDFGYGYGMGVGHFLGHRWFGHNGGAPGVAFDATVFPDDDAMVIVLSNRDPPLVQPLIMKLRADLFDPKACPN